jgi:hypothetical protein
MALMARSSAYPHTTLQREKDAFFLFSFRDTRCKAMRSAALSRWVPFQGALTEQARMADSLSLERKSKVLFTLFQHWNVLIRYRRGGVGMSALSSDERFSQENRSPAPLMHLIADVLSTSFSRPG